MRLRATLVFAAALAVSTSLLAQGPRRDGNWEVTMKMEMPGMPMAIPPIVTTRCITPAEASDPLKAMPNGGGRGGRGRGAEPKCTTSDYKTEGNKASWSMKCEGTPPTSGTGEITYSENAYSGLMKMDMGEGRGMTMTYSGKRLGECPK